MRNRERTQQAFDAAMRYGAAQVFIVCRALLAPDLLRALAFLPTPPFVVHETANVDGQSAVYAVGYNKNNEVAAAHG